MMIGDDLIKIEKIIRENALGIKEKGTRIKI